jgi:hypothetical protein
MSLLTQQSFLSRRIVLGRSLSVLGFGYHPDFVATGASSFLPAAQLGYRRNQRTVAAMPHFLNTQAASTILPVWKTSDFEDRKTRP